MKRRELHASTHHSHEDKEDMTKVCRELTQLHYEVNFNKRDLYCLKLLFHDLVDMEFTTNDANCSDFIFCLTDVVFSLISALVYAQSVLYSCSQ